MISPLALAAVIFVCTTLSIAGLLATAFYPRMHWKGAFDRRVRAIAGVEARPAASDRKLVDDSRSRQQSVEKTVRQLEQMQRARDRKSRRPPLALRLQQAHLGWSRRTYFIITAVVGLVCTVVALVATGSTLAALGFGIAGGLLLPHLYVGHKRKTRLKRFAAEFPGAIDVIVRGIKAGLPLTDCVRLIATEAAEPVCSEFKIVVDDQLLGMPVDEATQRLAERVPLSEASFFAIVIAIQSRTGGSLSDVLGNLSRVLRERKKMQGKIKAMSAEAKASGGIIGALPVVVAGLVYLTSPDYISLLATTAIGNMVLVASGLWMLMGVLVMRKMINFNF